MEPPPGFSAISNSTPPGFSDLPNQQQRAQPLVQRNLHNNRTRNFKHNSGHYRYNQQHPKNNPHKKAKVKKFINYKIFIIKE